MDRKFYIDDHVISEKVKKEYYNLFNKLVENKNPISNNSIACLICMESFLLHSLYVFRKYNDIIFRIRHNNDWDRLKGLGLEPIELSNSCILSIREIQMMTEYESMLYHARSTLDRMVFFICKQIFKQNKDSFDLKVLKLLNTIRHKDGVSESIDILNDSISQFQGILIDFEREKGQQNAKTGLRSLLAHSKSHDEATRGSLSILFFPGNEYLVFDQQLIDGVTLLESTHTMIKYIPYVVINLVSIFSNNEVRVSLKDCEPTWNKSWVVMDDFKYGEDIQRFSYSKIVDGTTTIFHADLNKDVLNYKQKLSI